MSDAQNQLLPEIGEIVPIWVTPSASLVHVNDTFYCVVTLAPAGATYPTVPPALPPAGTKVSLVVSAGSAVIVSSAILTVPSNGNTVVFTLLAGALTVGATYSRIQLTATVINPDGSTGASASNYGPNPALALNIYNDLVVIP